jgi:DNA repair protein RecN (Recombination protein N)
MLRWIKIQNIILVDRAVGPFGEGFNVITGETGSGKSAILGSIRLLLGDKADARLVRQGEEKGVVEATFDIDQLPHVLELLKEAGIDHDPSEDCIIRREVYAKGKSRSFINNQSAHLLLLKKIGVHLVDIVGQHANQYLLQTDYQRELLDLYGETRPLLKIYRDAWDKEKSLQRELVELQTQEAERLRQIDRYRSEVTELDEAGLTDGEEEETFTEFSRLTHADTLSKSSQSLVAMLSKTILPLLTRGTGEWDALAALDPSIEDSKETWKSARLDLEEVAYSLRCYQGRITHDPNKMAILNERLSLINNLKKRYGNSIPEIQAYHENAQEKLQQLENSDSRMDELESAISASKQVTCEALKAITTLRIATAKDLSIAVTEQIRSLNMPQAEFKIDLCAAPRSQHGEDKVECLLAPNPGERFVPLGKGISGGEIARVMLAFKALLAGKDQVPTLLFDELDANIGGETASIVGERLREIGQKHQVLCITHFAQVARYGDQHLRISKATVDGRTVTSIAPLDPEERREELARMLGDQGSESLTAALLAGV